MRRGCVVTRQDTSRVPVSLGVELLTRTVTEPHFPDSLTGMEWG